MKPLTPREREVLDLYGQNVSRKDIAAKLDLSVKTVNTYLDRCRDKLNIENAKLLRCAGRTP